jgi:hypothetical protein
MIVTYSLTAGVIGCPAFWLREDEKILLQRGRGTEKILNAIPFPARKLAAGYTERQKGQSRNEEGILLQRGGGTEGQRRFLMQSGKGD